MKLLCDLLHLKSTATCKLYVRPCWVQWSCSAIYHITLHFSALYCISLHFSAGCISVQRWTCCWNCPSAVQFQCTLQNNILNYIAFHCTLLHSIAFQCISLRAAFQCRDGPAVEMAPLHQKHRLLLQYSKQQHFKSQNSNSSHKILVTLLYSAKHLASAHHAVKLLKVKYWKLTYWWKCEPLFLIWIFTAYFCCKYLFQAWIIPDYLCKSRVKIILCVIRKSNWEWTIMCIFIFHLKEKKMTRCTTR